MNAAFTAAALVQERDPSTPLNIEACMQAARVCCSDDITGQMQPAHAFQISLWGQLARRGYLAVDFRLRGLRWEARLYRDQAWHLVSDLLDLSIDAAEPAGRVHVRGLLPVDALP